MESIFSREKGIGKFSNSNSSEGIPTPHPPPQPRPPHPPVSCHNALIEDHPPYEQMRPIMLWILASCTGLELFLCCWAQHFDSWMAIVLLLTNIFVRDFHHGIPSRPSAKDDTSVLFSKICLLGCLCEAQKAVAVFVSFSVKL